MKLSDQERAVVAKLAEAWNAFVNLPAEHPDDAAEFRHAIHAATAKVLMRPARRDLRGAD